MQLIITGRNTTIADSDLETFRKQAACLQFPKPATFHYDMSKGEETVHETTLIQQIIIIFFFISLEKSV